MSTVTTNQTLIEAVAAAMTATDAQTYFVKLGEEEEEHKVISIDDDSEDLEDQWEVIEADPANYLQIEPVSAKEALNLMREFASDLVFSRVDLHDNLMKALRTIHPFTEFKEELHISKAWQSWLDHRNPIYEKRAQAWLKTQGVID